MYTRDVWAPEWTRHGGKKGGLSQAGDRRKQSSRTISCHKRHQSTTFLKFNYLCKNKILTATLHSQKLPAEIETVVFVFPMVWTTSTERWPKPHEAKPRRKIYEIGITHHWGMIHPIGRKLVRLCTVVNSLTVWKFLLVDTSWLITVVSKPST